MGKADFNKADLAKFKKYDIEIVETLISEIQHENGVISNLVFNDGSSLNYDALYAAVPFTQHSDILHSLGCELTEHGYIAIDNFQNTTAKGVYACGDNSTMMRAVANSVYNGNFAGAMVNKELTDELF